MTVTKPGKGKPQTEAQRIAVVEMEREIVRRHGINGESFYSIERDLGITNADRIYRRAMKQRPEQEREIAARTQRMRLDDLYRRAHDALRTDGLETLFDRLRDLLNAMCEDGAEIDTARIIDVIDKAYADTYKGIPVALQVSDRAVKLDGLDHAARIADARLELDQATVQVWAGALVTALGLLDVPVADKRAVVERWGEIVAGQVESDEP